MRGRDLYPEDHLPEGRWGRHAMAQHEVIVSRIVAPDHPADDEQFIDIPVALGNFLGVQLRASVHIGGLGQDVGHVIALFHGQFRIIQMIGGHQMAPIALSLPQFGGNVAEAQWLQEQLARIGVSITVVYE